MFVHGITSQSLSDLSSSSCPSSLSFSLSSSSTNPSVKRVGVFAFLIIGGHFSCFFPTAWQCSHSSVHALRSATRHAFLSACSCFLHALFCFHNSAFMLLASFAIACRCLAVSRASLSACTAAQNSGPDNCRPTFLTSSLSLLDTQRLSFSDNFSLCASSPTSCSAMMQFWASIMAWLVAFHASDSTRVALYCTTLCSSSAKVCASGLIGGELRSCSVVGGIGGGCRMGGGGRTFAEVTSTGGPTMNAVVDHFRSLEVPITADWYER